MGCLRLFYRMSYVSQVHVRKRIQPVFAGERNRGHPMEQKNLSWQR